MVKRVTWTVFIKDKKCNSSDR